MSDPIKHECGIALLRLKKPLEYYLDKYGSALWGLNKMHLLMEKQHNRGQDGAGIANIKLDMQPGERYISRSRSVQKTQHKTSLIKSMRSSGPSMMKILNTSTISSTSKKMSASQVKYF